MQEIDNNFYKIIIAGGRNFENYDLLSKEVDKILYEYGKKFDSKYIEIVSGRACGTDKLGERYAIENNYKLTGFSANWNKYGKDGGPIRNKEMLDYANCLIAFHDGRSKETLKMITLAKAYKLKLFVINY